MVIIMMLVSLAPLVLITGFIGYRFETSYREKVLARLKELVQKHEQNIDHFLHEKLRDIGVIANSYGFEQLSNEAFLQHQLTILQGVYGAVFTDLGVVDEEGKQIAYAGPFQLRRADYSDAPWFREAITSQYYISDVFLGLRRSPHFIVTARREASGRVWVMRATIDFVAFNSLVENIQIGETGLAFILNRQGDFQTQPRHQPAATQEFFLRYLTAEDEPEGAAATGQGDWKLIETAASSPGATSRVIVVEERPYFGAAGHLYVMASLKGGEWILVYQQDMRDAFAALYRSRNLAIIFFLFGTSAIAVAALLLSRRMVRRIEAADREKEMMNEQVIEAGKLASVGELAAGIAHEINNPVAVMVEEAGWIEDLLDEPDAGDAEHMQELRRALKQIRTQGARCKEITHKLLSFARKTDPKVREVQLNELLEEIVGLSEQSARYANVKLKMNLEPDLPTVNVSPSEMQQVFLNLINNAIDAIGTKGGEVEVTSRTDGNHVIVDVADNGQGIPKANLARIFDPFFTTKPVGKGTGLGLSICYGIIKKSGGVLSVNSAVGLGTTFHVRIPRAPAEKR
jgi:two-component system NtrC family sensor kinase